MEKEAEIIDSCRLRYNVVDFKSVKTQCTSSGGGDLAGRFHSTSAGG